MTTPKPCPLSFSLSLSLSPSFFPLTYSKYKQINNYIYLSIYISHAGFDVDDDDARDG